MEYNKEKVDDISLALLFLTSFEEMGIIRAWKGMAWDVLNRLHAKGYILNPKNKNKSVVFTAEGYKMCKQLFKKHFSLDSPEND